MELISFFINYFLAKREIESQRELTVKDKAIADLLLEFGASMNSRKRKNPASEVVQNSAPT